MKSSELSEKQKEDLIVHCSSFRYCSKCGYDNQCVEYDEYLSDMIKYNIPFEIKLLPEHEEEKKMDYETKCKNCKQGYGYHRDSDNRCPLLDFKGDIAKYYYSKTFFEVEKSEVDKLIEKMENGDLFVSGDIHSGKLLKELKELRK